MELIPTLSVDLIETLDTEYPTVLPKPEGDRLTELYKAGQRSVIDYLRDIQKNTPIIERK